ncbi:HutD/Ves family protein [Thermomonas fusca]|nr:HutD family protein [Thermomonas fusca]
MNGRSTPAALVLRAQDYRRMRWKNGAGWTSEVFRFPDADDWGWRLSIAEVETDAPFSTFPGVERALVLLEGNGMRLHFDDGDTRELLPSSNVLCFSGERPLVGQLVDGPSRDFNLMWKREQVDAQLWRRPLAGAMVLFAGPGETWVVHMLSGQAHFPGSIGPGEMECGDTAILRGHGARNRFALDGAGELLLIRVVGRDEA